MQKIPQKDQFKRMSGNKITRS